MSDNAIILHDAKFLAVGASDYLGKINSIPMLSAKEELDLAKKFHENNDLAAAQKLVMAHLRLVVNIARKYAGYGLNTEDLVQEGAVGLMKAVKRYEPSKMVRLATFAIHWIKAEIQDYIIKNWRLVKIATTKAQKKLFYNLRKLRKDTSWMTHEERLMVAKELDVPIKEVETMEQRLTVHDVKLYQPADDDDSLNINKVESSILDREVATVEEDVIRADTESKVGEMLKQSFAKLDERLKRIIEKRYLGDKKSTLDDLAKELSISKERVRQLENKAIKQLKDDCATLIA